MPPTTLGTVRLGHESNAAQALQFGADHVAFVYPLAHPGTQAPLGWTLSGAATTELESQLQNPYVRRRS
jgi:hypothetical protein